MWRKAHEQFLGTRCLVEGSCLPRECTLDAMYVTECLLTRSEVQASADVASVYARTPLRFFDGGHGFPEGAQVAALQFLQENRI